MFRVYVDESGTRHISAKASRYFVVSAVMVHESYNDRVREQLAELKTSLGRMPEQILHFRNLRPKSKRLEATEGVADFTLARVINVILDKQLVGEEGLAGDVSFIAQPDPMYLWALRLLMERVSWYARDRQGQPVKMTFSHVQGFKVGKLLAYREALERKRDDPDMRIAWEVFDSQPFVIGSPKTVDLLQVADVTASSVFQAVEPGRDGDGYLDRLRKALYRRPPQPITSYGLKVFPKRIGEPGGELHHLASL